MLSRTMVLHQGLIASLSGVIINGIIHRTITKHLFSLNHNFYVYFSCET